MTGTIKVALTALHLVNEYNNRPSFLARLPYRPSIQQLVDCKPLVNLTVNKIRELHIDRTVRVDRKTSYRLVDTVIEIDINTLKENIGEICEALNLRPAIQSAGITGQLKSLPLVDPESKVWRD